MDMEPIRFTLTEGIVVKAAQLHGKKYVVVYLGFAVIVALLLSAYFLIGDDDVTIERAMVQVLGTLVGGLCITGCFAALLHFLINPFYARRNFRQQKMLGQEMTLSWTQERYVIAIGMSQTDMAFADLHGYRASDDLVLLYLAEALYHAVPIISLGEGLTRDLLEKLEAAHVKRR
jgi:hypothetical protein